MAHKVGSIVAIEPATGEILAMVSAPAYDPNLLVGRIRGKNYQMLMDDPIKPLFNRALMANYSPGSIFKIVQALVGLEMGAIQPSTGFPCNRSLVNCHNHPPAFDVHSAIQYSCNPYFYSVYRRIIQYGKSSNIYKDAEDGLRQWHDMVTKFGLGHKLGIDIPSEQPGFMPDVAFYDRW
jgi:penicillin-binding protein 2